MRHLYLLPALAVAAGLPGACVAWQPVSNLTYLGTPQPEDESRCRPSLYKTPPPPGAKLIAIDRVGPLCWDETPCVAKLRRTACEVGANAAYGVHLETGLRNQFLVGTLAVDPDPPAPDTAP